MFILMLQSLGCAQESNRPACDYNMRCIGITSVCEWLRRPLPATSLMRPCAPDAAPPHFNCSMLAGWLAACMHARLSRAPWGQRTHHHLGTGGRCCYRDERYRCPSVRRASCHRRAPQCESGSRQCPASHKGAGGARTHQRQAWAQCALSAAQLVATELSKAALHGWRVTAPWDTR